MHFEHFLHLTHNVLWVLFEGVVEEFGGAGVGPSPLADSLKKGFTAIPESANCPPQSVNEAMLDSQGAFWSVRSIGNSGPWKIHAI